MEVLGESEFVLHYILRLTFSKNSTNLIIRAEVQRVPRKGESVPVPNEPPPREIPLEVFQTQARLAAYIDALPTEVSRLVHLSIAYHILQDVSAAINTAAVDAGLILDRKEVNAFNLKQHAKNDAQFQKNRLGIRGRGKFSRWTKTDLKRAVKSAKRALPENKRTLEHVHQKLKEEQPDRAPKSKDALKQLLYKLNLKFSML